MKNLFLTSILLTAALASSSVYASKLTTIKNFTNPDMNTVSSELISMDLITHSGAKKVLELKGKGTSAQEIRQNTVAQALHTLCPFFDDGVSLALNSKDHKGSLQAVNDLIDSTQVSDGDPEYKTLLKSISEVNEKASIEVYSGGASGNNTYGTVLGFYDLKNHEIAVFSNTNCGSDN